MAYLMGWFARSGEPVAQRIAPALLEAASRLEPDLVAVHVHDGVGTVDYEVFAGPTSPPAGVPVLLSVRTGLRAADLAHFIEPDSPAELLQCDTRIELILSGPFTDADWSIVRGLHRAAVELWDALLWDEMDGFAVTLG
ncbi:hypothetical protein AB0J72_34380 [Dactylosporangium sp. NPDC049742]|uniref:hypothetical protein n=1 Tax=Dactylosporangium sp. NPDC049742 TaxID=3154737 RepID=UPI00342981F5